ncbi:MAG TPA: AbrB/MazE/SpoVT family DNA-binding domain-containing protein [Dehalococcoidia bacterium]|nr:AbrB/MazE/SpoVT family DNA-binding domain-containing protein [Dehalococcoidia bacterium]
MAARRLVRIQGEGNVPLPADLMRRHHLKPGDEVALEETDQGVLVTSQADGGTINAEHVTALHRPGPDELARRKAAVERILLLRAQTPSIAPLTTADLVRMAREDAIWYGDDED